MKFAAIKKHAGEFPIRLMCEVLNVKPSSYYAWTRRKPSMWERNRREIGKVIQDIFRNYRGVYGSPRITDTLKDMGSSHSKNYIARVMREHGIRSKTARRYRVTTNSKHEHPVFPNVLRRNFKVSAPDRAWVSDITYVWTDEGWLYLCVFLDLYSRKIVGWSLEKRLTAELVTSALKTAIEQRKPEAGLIVHSDRGIQYASFSYRSLLKMHKFIGSMSRKGDCWDNAVAESFFGTLKREHLKFQRYRTRQEARTDIFDFIEVFYNRERKHSSIGYRTPVEFDLAA